ncbi:alpha/beta hydrolase [Escherichia coli]
MINRLMWIWRGIDHAKSPRPGRIVMSDADHSDHDLYDTVIGYRGGNWIYEWATRAMVWQQKACAEENPQLSGRHSAACGYVVKHCRLSSSERR